MFSVPNLEVCIPKHVPPRSTRTISSTLSHPDPHPPEPAAAAAAAPAAAAVPAAVPVLATVVVVVGEVVVGGGHSGQVPIAARSRLASTSSKMVNVR